MYRAAGETNKGVVRKKNEDCFGLVHDEASFQPGTGLSQTLTAVIADGIGGHGSGELVSYICCRDLLSAFSRKMPKNAGEAAWNIPALLSGINEKIFARNLREQRMLPMGSTIVVGCFFPNELFLASAGDSRCYVLVNGEFRQLTTDHVQCSPEPGKREDAPSVMLVRSIGPRHNLLPDFQTIPVLPGSRYLICTDGIYRAVQQDRLRSILASGTSPRKTVSSIIRAALLGNARDNVTAICVFSEDERSK